MLLQEMVNKYERQQQRLDESVKDGLKRGENKSKLIQLLKQKKIVIHYIGVCNTRRNQLIQKQYAVEQLNLTAMQIKALQSTANLYKSFHKQHNIEKLEQLQDTMIELTDQVTDINDVLESQPLIDIDEEELMKELNSLDVEDKSVINIIEMPIISHIDETKPLLDTRILSEAL